MIVLAVTIIIPIAQCTGHRPFVTSVLGPDRVTSIKELIEESIEAIGYFLILLSSLECFFGLRFITKNGNS